ncbi:MAG: 6-bladed beta-propeller [Planctomycetota bacterium]|nr:6-bladed beta-propeller [Planctomycetota bacterium]
MKRSSNNQLLARNDCWSSLSMNLLSDVQRFHLIHLMLIAPCLLVASGCERASAKTTSTTSFSFGSHGTGPGQFAQPRAIAASPDGKVFVIDRTGRVQRFTSTGEYEHSWEMPDNDTTRGKPSGICVDGDGRVFVADTHNSRVVVFDRDGHELFRFGEHGIGPGQFMLPTDVAVDRDGCIYVSEYGGNDRISKFTPDGEYLFSFGDPSSGSGMLQHPSGLAVDADGNLWVADTSNHRVCCFDPRGMLLTTIGRMGLELSKLRYPRDVTLLADRHLIVVEEANNRLSCFSRRGQFLGCWGQGGRGNSGLYAPMNVTTIRGRDAFIADTQNHRVQCITELDLVFSDGRESELTSPVPTGG